MLLGGSDIAVAAKSPNQDLAKEVVALMLSDDYQTIMAEAGLTPAKDSLGRLLGDDEFAQATIEAASNAKLTPAVGGLGARWRARASSRTCSSRSPRAATSPSSAAAADEAITAQLNVISPLRTSAAGAVISPPTAPAV